MVHGPEVTVAHPAKSDPINLLSKTFHACTNHNPTMRDPTFNYSLLIILDMRQIAVLSGHLVLVLVQYQQNTYHKRVIGRARKLSDRHQGGHARTKRRYHNNL